MSEPERMKPIMVLPVDAMKPEDIAALRDNGLCVVEAKEPALVRFMDPIPAVHSRTKIEDAAIQLSRRIMNKNFWTHEDTRKTVIATYLDLLIEGTPLDPKPSKEERERKIFEEAKADELRRLAREEAKAEREAAKAAKKK